MTVAQTAAHTGSTSTGLDLAPIVSVAWLAAHLDDVTVVDVRPRDQYLDGHVPGAISLPLQTAVMDSTTQPELTGLGRDIQRALAATGISPTDMICIIDGGDGTAQVAVLFCELAGVESTGSVLGGQDAWVGAGHDIEHSVAETTPSEFSHDLNFASIASIEDLQYAAHGGTHLIDVRSQLEHEGIIGSPTCPVRGHIPGSLHLEWSTVLGADGQQRSFESVRHELQGIGLGLGDDIIVYCHMGIRASVASAALRTAGFNRVRTSLGSWHEWALRGLPVAPEPD